VNKGMKMGKQMAIYGITIGEISLTSFLSAQIVLYKHLRAVRIYKSTWDLPRISIVMMILCLKL
jgi:hypothetical protein